MRDSIETNREGQRGVRIHTCSKAYYVCSETTPLRLHGSSLALHVTAEGCSTSTPRFYYSRGAYGKLRTSEGYEPLRNSTLDSALDGLLGNVH